jgi:predicted dienelactone hydrolase
MAAIANKNSVTAAAIPVVTARSLIVVVLLGACTANTPQGALTPSYPVGIKQLEVVDAAPDEGVRHLALNVFYPAQSPGPSAQQFPPIPFFTDLNLFRDLEPISGGPRHPLILLSHGRGGNGLNLAWFAQILAGRGYIVAALDHYRANTYDSSIIYLHNKLWQRPKDLTLITNFLLNDPFWRALIEPSKIGVAGHSQGGFTSLWLGGARVNPDKYLAFQRDGKNNSAIPAYLRDQMPLDATPALDVADPRVGAVFAMAPGELKYFGMDEEGLHHLEKPTYITVGAKDTQALPNNNAEFAAANIPGAQLNVIPNAGHFIFFNECTQAGRDAIPDECIDPPGVDRTALHREIGDAAVRFFRTALGA